ncbi:MAG: MBL fold metallo-hydrolase [Candidatus Diapherotrites archaeon]|nr:MBL fold metallo-hydrolase [Candidatus Diapherotrites archaeon]
MQVSYKKGLNLDNALVIDPLTKKHGFSDAIITHAHSDHVCLNPKTQFYVTPSTLDLLELNYPAPNTQWTSVPFRKKIQLNDFEVSFHNAGHILGSTQLLVQNSSSMAITSDFKLQNSLTEKGAEFLQAETLVIESTFGLPSFVFPDREQVYSEMKSWIQQQVQEKKFVVLTGYALGKAQELTAFCNEYLGIAPIVHEKVFENNKIYENHKVKLGNYFKLDHNLNDSSILIMPPSWVTADVLQALEFSLHRPVVSAKASGWPYPQFYDKVFSLSDHADFNQLMEYVKQCNPKQVFTIYGYASEFAWHIRSKLKIPARALQDTKSQSMLQEFD